MVAVAAPFATPEKLHRARELVRTLAVAHTNAALYPMTHPSVVQSIADLVDAVAEVRNLGFEEVTVNIYKGTLFVENQVFPEESVTYRKLIEDLLARGISAVTFPGDLEPNDAASVRRAAGRPADRRHRRRQELPRAAAASPALHVSETTAMESHTDEERERQVRAQSREAYEAGVGAMRDVERQAKLGKVFEVSGLQHTVSAMLDNLFHDPAAVLGLTAIKGHDDYTLNHAINVCILVDLARRVARAREGGAAQPRACRRCSTTSARCAFPRTSSPSTAR